MSSGRDETRSQHNLACLASLYDLHDFHASQNSQGTIAMPLPASAMTHCTRWPHKVAQVVQNEGEFVPGWTLLRGNVMPSVFICALMNERPGIEI